MLSGPPGTQKPHDRGTDASRKCVCFSPASSGIMKPWMRCGFWLSASCSGWNTGSTLFFSTRVFTAVSVDQGTTSLRWGSGAIGLLGLRTPGPVPCGTGEESWAWAPAASAAAAISVRAAFMAEGSSRSMLVLHPAVFSNGQALAGSLQFLVAGFRFLARFEALGGRLVRRGHGAVALDVLLHLL